MAEIQDDAPRATRSRQWSKQRQTTLEVLGIADPEKDRLAEYLASITPEGSFLRSNMAGRIIGFIMGRFEGEADKIVNPMLSGIAEEFTDLVKAYGAALGHTPSEGALHALANVNDIQWRKKFWDAVPERIKNASDKAAEKQSIQTEFTLLCEIDHFIQSSIVAPKEPNEKHHKTIREDWKYVKTAIKNDAAKLNAVLGPSVHSFNEKLKARQAARRK